MGKRDKRYDRLAENCDFDGILFIQECEIFELVDFLLSETNRLRHLVLEARSEANYLALRHTTPPYPEIGENAYNACFDNHPAMLRYYELYG
jgi:hypothetical protein